MSLTKNTISLSRFFLLLPIYIYYVVVFQTPSNMPYWDDYDSIFGFLEQFDHSNFYGKIDILFRQHNEHRIVFDRLIFLADRFLTGSIQVYFLNIIGSLGLLAIFILIMKMAKAAKIDEPYILPLSFLLFNLGQWSLIDFAMASIQQYWQLFFALSAIYIMVDTENRFYFVKLSCLTIISCFTGAGGFILFPVGLAQFSIQKDWRNLAYWSGLMIAMGWIYFVFLPYHNVNALSPEQALIQRPIGVLAYFFSFLGNSAPGMTHLIMALLSIIIGFLLFFLSLKYALPILVKKTSPANRRIALVILFVFGTAGSAGLSRICFGISEAISSRYDVYGFMLISMIYMAAFIRSTDEVKRRKIYSVTALIAFFLFFERMTPSIILSQNKVDIANSSIDYPNQKMGANILKKAMEEGFFKPSYQQQMMILGKAKPD